MVSIKKLSAFTLSLCCVLIIWFTSQSLASQNNGTGEANVSSTAASDDHKVNLLLYYESLCPFCANFIVNQLVKVFQTDMSSIVNLRMIPWGNTQITPNKSWVCQHGPNECLLNTVEACSITIWPDVRTHFRFIECIERRHLENRLAQWQSCFGSLGLSSTPIRDCFNNGLGFRLELSYSDETASLNPAHTFVPWVLVDNLPLKQDYQNFIGYICRAYRGRNVPNACKSPQLKTHSSVMKDSIQVCYVEGKKNSTLQAQAATNSPLVGTTTTHRIKEETST